MAIPGRFGAVVTAMVTPFDDNGVLDLDAAATVARWLADNGSEAIVAAGTTGEGAVLTDEEKRQLWRVTAEAVTIPVIAGAGSNDTRHSVELTKEAEQAGAAGVLAVTPYYNRPSQAGIEAHFRAVAGATRLPVLLYDIPSRTGRKVAHETLLRLAREVRNVAGVKDAAGDLAGSARLVAEAPDGFDVYSGDDALTLALCAVGASGVIGVATNWAGRLHGDMMAALAKGDVDEARRLNTSLLESFSYETSEMAPNPVPAKAMMRVLGLPVGQCRLPMGPAPEGLEDRAREVLARLGDAGPSRL
ncbi:MAG: 4-hydroxy-tetrahydrodipicolinate synthase [Actinomycetota bacterium]|nr:4-hydroxy-tetrahydrodipicolinate synthase [Actinomycetota bacterium]MDQ3680895.1 4-hydroxy-tetrahydrodipicolinate synthase [Actinomycetota bacterium]